MTTESASIDDTRRPAGPDVVRDYLAAVRADPVLSRLHDAYLRTTVDTPLGPRDAVEAVRSSSRLALVGPPGSGKTTALQVALFASAGDLVAADGPLPVYVDLARARAGDGVETLVRRAVGGDAPGPATLLVDHLDRATDVYLLEGLELLLRAGGRAGPTVVLACRDNDWPQYRSWFADLPVARLQPLAPVVVTDALRRSLPEPVAEAARAWLARDRALSVAVAAPMALAAFVTAVADRPAEGWQRAHVLDALLEATLARVPSAERAAYRSALADVALDSLGQGRLVEVDTVAMGLGVTRDDMIRTGAVVARGARLEFVEPLLAHHCAASRLAESAASDPRRLAARLGDLSSAGRADTMVHVYDLAPDRAAFAHALMGLPGGPELAARCLTEPAAADPGGPAGEAAVVEELCGPARGLPAPALFRLGEALHLAGRDELAEVALASALDRAGDGELEGVFERVDVDPSPEVARWVRDFLAGRNRGLVLRASRDADRAAGALDEAGSALGRLEADLTFERGLTAEAAGDRTAALSAFASAVAAEPEVARYLYHYGAALLDAERIEDAVHHLQRARDLVPAQPLVELALGRAYRALGWLEEALQSFVAAGGSAPTDPAALQLAGEVRAELGDLELAADEMQRAVAARPEVEWLDALGQVLCELGRPAAGAAALASACALAPDLPGPARRLGRAHLAAGATDRAVVALRRAADLAPDDPGVLADLGHALAAAGDEEAALSALGRAVELDGAWPADHLAIARIARSTGRREVALAHARRAAELAPASELARAELALAGAAVGGDAADPGRGDLPSQADASAPFGEAGDADGPAATGVADDVLGADPRDAEIERLTAAVRAAPTDSRAARELASALVTADRSEAALGVLRRAARLCPSDADVRHDLAAAALAQGRINEAREVAVAALRLAPDRADLHSLMAEVEAVRGDPAAARESLRAALALAPGERSYALRLADLQRPADAAAARALLEQLAATGPDGQVSRRLAAIHAAAGRWALAAEQYAVARAEDPDEPELTAAHGAALLQAGRLDEAVATMESGWRPDRDCSSLLAQLAVAYEAGGRDRDALEAYTAAGESGGLDDQAMVRWSQLARRLGDTERAIAAARAAVERGPARADALAALADAYAAAGQMAGALVAMRRAADLAPEEPSLRVAHAEIALRAGQAAEAATAAATGLARRPDDAELHHALGRALGDLDRAAESVAALRRATELAPDVAAYHRALARALAAGDPTAAEAAWRSVLGLEPSDADAHAALGDALVAQGRLPAAQDAFAAAVRLAPDAAAHWRSLGCLRLERGDHAGGIEALERALGLAPADLDVAAALAGARGDGETTTTGAPAETEATATGARGEIEAMTPGKAAEPIGVDAADAEPTGVPAATEEPTGVDAAAAGPMGMSAAAAEVTGVDAAAGEPVEADRFDDELALRYGEAVAAEGWSIHLVAPEPPPPDAGRAARAAAALGRVMRGIDPAAAARAATALAVIRGRTGDGEGALGAAVRAVGLVEDPATLSVLAWAHLAVGGPLEAQAALSRARALGAAGPTVDGLEALAWAERGDAVAALAAAERAGADEAAEIHAAVAARLERGGSAEDSLPSWRAANVRDGRYDARLGRAALAAGRVAEARAALERAAEAMPLDAELQHDLAAARAGEGDAEAATAALQLACRLAPDRPSWQAALGDLEMGAGAPEQAYGHFRRAFELAPDEPAYGLAAAEAAAEIGRADDARACAVAVLDLAPRTARAHALLGRLAAAGGDHATARECFAAAVDIDPADGDLRYRLGVAAKSTGDRRSALEHLEAAVRLAPAATDTYLALGEVYAADGLVDDAIQAYQQAVVCEPQSPEPHLRLGAQCGEAGLTEKALAHLQRASELSPDDYRPRYAMAQVYLRARETRQAVAAFEAAVAAAPADPAVLYDAAMAYKSLRDYGRAADLLRRVSHISPKSAAVRAQLAAVHALGFIDRMTTEAHRG